MIYLLIFTIPAALFVLYKFPFWEAARDKKAIDANGSADTLKEVFHAKRAARRFALIVAVAGAATAPLFAVAGRSWALAAGGLAIAGLGWFFYQFNPRLSVARGLDPYYLSADARAAFFPDRLLTKLGLGLKPVSVALLIACLAACLALATAAVVVAARS